jgi:hypothetical protein
MWLNIANAALLPQKTGILSFKAKISCGDGENH